MPDNADEKRIEAVARALARTRYPLADAPEPQEIDFHEARRFIAAHDAIMALPPVKLSYWEKELERHAIAVEGGDC